MSDKELVEQFKRNGYVAIENAFTLEEVGQMRVEADAILELIVNSSIGHGRCSRRLDILQKENGDQVVRKIQPINDLSLFLTQVSADERFQGPMHMVMGDEPILMEEKLNYKEPLPQPVSGFEMKGRASDRFPIHSDWAYYKAQNYPQSIISSAIAMDDCTVESGPLHIWPGSHKEDLPHDKVDIGLEVKPGLIDPDGGIDLLVQAGTVLLFSSLLVHNSRPNLSGKPRRLMIYSHYPKAANVGADVRNGPTRLHESPYEWEYIRKRDRGEVSDVFKAPTF
ncbi:MAG: phytanoyl-CoA dioxygenase family protein [Candidatus Latescibacterota bacterium]|nr:phytanoyl-CoA dioxygenase family protein [Candidatus Latescibacterota bacterium]